MQKITQRKLKEAAKLKQKKYRKQNKKVVVNGQRIIEQIINNGIWPEEIYLTNPEIAHVFYEKKLQNVFEVTETQMKKISSNDSPQSVAAIFNTQFIKLKKKRRLLFLDRINDPGNLGTIIRTACSTNLDGIILSPDCVDPFNPKVISSSMGAVFSYPITVMSEDQILELPNKKIVTCLENAENIYEFTPPESYILVIGSEAHGASQKLIENADSRIVIPMSNQMESLNAAVAAGISMSYISYKGEK
jgi:TrmH family RNA methyltransferase